MWYCFTHGGYTNDPDKNLLLCGQITSYVTFVPNSASTSWCKRDIVNQKDLCPWVEKAREHLLTLDSNLFLIYQNQTIFKIIILVNKIFCWGIKISGRLQPAFMLTKNSNFMPLDLLWITCALPWSFTSWVTVEKCLHFLNLQILYFVKWRHC